MPFHKKITFGLAIIALIICTGCARFTPRPEEPTTPVAVEKATPDAELKALLKAVNARLDDLEGRLAALGDRADGTRAMVENLIAGKRAQLEPLKGHPSEGQGGNVEPAAAENDPEPGFTQDEAVQAYRKAMVLFESHKYPEAMLAFSHFVQANPDHPLAGSAQYYVGESYYQQKEYKLAHQEYLRVLGTYDQSSHVSFALARLAETEDLLKRPDSAEKRRQLLATLFPTSPAARTGRQPQSIDTVPEETPALEPEEPPTAPVE